MGVPPLAPGEPQPSGPLEPERVIATVRALVHEFELVHLEGPDGLTLSIGKRTRGVNWRELEIGQRLECKIEGEHAVRIVRARVLPALSCDPEAAPGNEPAP